MILFTRNLITACHQWISKIIWQKLWLEDIVIICDCSPEVYQASKNLMNHPCLERSQPRCPSSSRSEWNAIIARMKAQITKNLGPIRHVACTYAWLQRETDFWSIISSFPSRLHCLLYTFLKINYSYVDLFIINTLSSMYSNIINPCILNWTKNTDSIAVVVNMYL